MSTSVEESTKAPRYLQLADHLREMIRSGELAPNAPLPSFSEMKASFDVAQRTIEKAHTLLEEDGLIRREPRRGLFVNDPTMRPKTDFVAFVDEKVVRDWPYQRKILQGLRIQAEALGKSLALVDAPVTFKHWKQMDGIVLDKFAFFKDSDFAHLCPPNIPIVRLHRPEEGVNSVMADDTSGIRMAVEHLLELGHRRIGYLLRERAPEHGPDTPSVNKIRHDTYCQVMRENGIDPLPAWTNFYHTRFYDFRDAGHEAMQRWLQEGWREQNLTAILAQNDYAAIGMIKALAEESIRVPEDVSIVGFDGVDFSYAPNLELTTIIVPLRKIGETAMKLLSDAVDRPSLQPQSIKLPVRLHKGATTSPAKDSSR